MKLPKLVFVVSFFSLLASSCGEKKKSQPLPPPTTLTPGDTLTLSNFDTTSSPYIPVDISPMDMSYFPVDYPKLKMTNNHLPPPVMRVIYSRPHRQGREMFHDVLKYGEHWRMGANEATEIDFYRDVSIQGKQVKTGRYIIYCILGPATWTVILNTNLDSWGLQQDTTKDVHRFEIPVTHGNPVLEYYTMKFEKTSYGADLLMAWDDVIAKLPINFTY
jgi:hypothetical protein